MRTHVAMYLYLFMYMCTCLSVCLFRKSLYVLQSGASNNVAALSVTRKTLFWAQIQIQKGNADGYHAQPSFLELRCTAQFSHTLLSTDESTICLIRAITAFVLIASIKPIKPLTQTSTDQVIKGIIMSLALAH